MTLRATPATIRLMWFEKPPCGPDWARAVRHLRRADPVLRGVFGGDLASASEILADDTGIELLIARLEEQDDEITWDA